MEPEEKIEPEIKQTPIETEKEEISVVTSGVEGAKPNLLKRFWFIFAALGIVLALSIGAFFISRQQPTPPAVVSVPTPVPSPTPTEEDEIAALEQQGTSDETTAIEADLNKTDLSKLDQELADIDDELAAP